MTSAGGSPDPEHPEAFGGAPERERPQARMTGEGAPPAPEETGPEETGPAETGPAETHGAPHT